MANGTLEIVVWRFDGDVPLEAGWITEREPGVYGAVATEPSPPRRLVYRVREPSGGLWSLVAYAAARAGELGSM